MIFNSKLSPPPTYEITWPCHPWTAAQDYRLCNRTHTLFVLSVDNSSPQALPRMMLLPYPAPTIDQSSTEHLVYTDCQRCSLCDIVGCSHGVVEGIRSPGKLRYVNWYLLTDVSGKRIRPIIYLDHRRWDRYIFLTLILLAWRIWWAPNNANRWQMGFKSAFKGLNGGNKLPTYAIQYPIRASTSYIN